MELNLKNLENKKFWEEKGYVLPKFDIDEVHRQTKLSPHWVHFGVGNIFRAFPASICQNLLNQGLIATGITAVEGYDYEIIEKSMRKYDNLTINVTLKSDGSTSKEIIASITESLCMTKENENDMERLREIFRNDSLKLASFTITEKGYNLKDKDGKFLKNIENDFKNPPSIAESYIGKVTALCFERFKHKQLPLTLLSMDNCSHNGTKLERAILEFAENWIKNDFIENDFIDYIKEKISFPWSMIDKITPRPSDKVLKILQNDGIENIDPVITEKNTYTAPFVNGEETEYLIVENDFKNGKIPLNKSNKKGVLFTDKETVDKTEKMKVCTCLNPLHTTLAVFGCLLSYEKISEEMKNPVLVKLIKNLSEKESLPVVINPKIIDPSEFLNEVITVRFPNNFMPDSPQRIACDTSQKLSIRFGETIKAYLNSEIFDLKDLEYIPLIIAGWLRYLTGYNDKGENFELSPDPYIETLKPITDEIKFGENNNIEKPLEKILSNTSIFGLDLCKTSLYPKIINYFKELNSGKNSVINTLTKYVS
ncbi:MAG: mannitol dehydrogenase family protein [Clostridiales bacterium]|nr:mannitol dehydrogenase family protein [Clostridiales bacterium]